MTEVQQSKPKSAESHAIMVAIGMVVIDIRPYIVCAVSMHSRKKVNLNLYFRHVLPSQYRYFCKKSQKIESTKLCLFTQ